MIPSFWAGGGAVVMGGAAAFDRMAASYDAVFTESVIGRAQRKVVWDALKRIFRRGDRILELNCGTGEDAHFLASRGISVLACDASARMIEVAQGRRLTGLMKAQPQFQILRNEDLHHLSDLVFDGALSNFSGLNCVADLQKVAVELGRLVKHGGSALICVSSRVCLWEMLWYGARLNSKKAFRRLSGASVAHLDGVSVPVWYPTIRAMRRAFRPWFRLRSVRAVGLFIPPSYAESWARNHRTVLALLERMDWVCAGCPILRGAGDHVLLEFKRTLPQADGEAQGRRPAAENRDV
jgi:ubiquinone/menaquinone biosynthesis C-methylase UbiE